MGILHVPGTHVHVLLWGIYPAVRFLNHNCMFSFRRRHQLSKVVVPKYTPLPMSVTPHLRQHLVLLGFLFYPLMIRDVCQKPFLSLESGKLRFRLLGTMRLSKARPSVLASGLLLTNRQMFRLKSRVESSADFPALCSPGFGPLIASLPCKF